jgi:hypothetical protein
LTDYSIIIDALVEHLTLCAEHLTSSERLRLGSLLENYKRHLEECALDGNTQSFDWSGYICDDSSGFLMAGRIPLTAISVTKVSGRGRSRIQRNYIVDDEQENRLPVIVEEPHIENALEGRLLNESLYDGEILED